MVNNGYYIDPIILEFDFLHLNGEDNYDIQNSSIYNSNEILIKSAYYTKEKYIITRNDHDTISIPSNKKDHSLRFSLFVRTYTKISRIINNYFITSLDYYWKLGKELTSFKKIMRH